MRAPDGLAQAAAELLRDVVVTADLEQARRIVRDHPELKAVTRAGDLLGSRWAQGGGARPQSLFEQRAAADEAAAGLAGAAAAVRGGGPAASRGGPRPRKRPGGR